MTPRAVTATSAGSTSPTGGSWSRRDLLHLRDLSRQELVSLLSAGRRFAQAPADATHDALRGRSIANLFFEDSTRTRVSFSIAAQRLGGTAVDLTGAGSSLSKGETLLDTARVIESMGVSAIVVRSAASGAPAQIAGGVSVPVLNAGDGRHEHPTQGLIDALAIAEAHDRTDAFDLSGLRVAIVGDIASSRVARSDIAALTTLGAEVVCVGPPALAPRGLESLGCTVSHDLDDVIGAVDAVQMLRIQFERHAGVASLREYRTLYQLDEARAARMKAGCVVLHPGPVNRGVEIASIVADGPRSLILRQTALGVFVRMGALALCVGASR